MRIKSLPMALTVIAVAAEPIPARAGDIAGISIGMESQAVANTLTRLGAVKLKDETSKATTLTVDNIEVLVCSGKVVGAKRRLSADFHTFGRVVDSERRVVGDPFDQSLYHSDEGGKKATSLGYFWLNKDRSVYSVHFSQFETGYETVEILDYPRDDYDRLPDLCGYALSGDTLSSNRKTLRLQP